MSLDGQMQRQAVMHGVADAIVGIARLQVVTDVYDERYWADYRAGFAAWKQAEQMDSMPAGHRPQPAAQGAPDGQPHPDATLAGRGWHTSGAQYGRDAGGMYTRTARAAESTGTEQPYAMRLLDGLRAAGEWSAPRTVVQDYQRSRMAELEREWAADPPTGFGLEADGPEAG